MKITPLDIRQKTFEKHFRGYDKDEVTSFLTLMSQEWEKMTEEKNMLRMKYEQAEKEASKLREVEESLFKTLKTAEDTGASIIKQANKTAELILKEAQMNADALNAESKNKARNMVDQAESQAKNIIEDLKEDIGVLVEGYEKLMKQRDSLLKNLKKTASETLENVKHIQEDFSEVDISAHSRMIKELQRKDKYYASMGREDRPPKKENYQPEHQDQEEGNTYTWEQPAKGLDPDPNLMEEDLPLDQQEEVEEPKGSETDEMDEVKEDIQEEQSEKKPENNKQSGSFFDQFD
ncbi:MAG: DivIVA domain-containing protein [Cyclobacteriaceae bacterium]